MKKKTTQQPANAMQSLFPDLEESPFTLPEPKVYNDNRDTNNYNMLALDVATLTGYCLHDTSGTWDFTSSTPPAKKNQAGRLVKNKRLPKFWDKLEEIAKSHKIQVIVFEKPIIYRAKKRRPNFTSFEMAGVLKLFCLEKSITLIEYNAAHIKKFATGAGNAKKDEMINACIRRYNVTPVDDNEADAVHLYHLAIQDLKL